ncbi:hypothetical protein EMIT0P265_360003 [Pseudomonas zeae]
MRCRNPEPPERSWPVVWRDAGPRLQAPTYERLVWVAFQKGHQYFHPHTWDGDASVMRASLSRGDAQPAAGFVIAQAFTAPVKLHFDAAVLITVDFLTFGAGDHRAVAGKDARLA